MLTTSGGTFPIVTPVAISKTLPPAITAMQQQQQQENGKIYVLNALLLRLFAAPVLVFPLRHIQPKTSCKTVIVFESSGYGISFRANCCLKLPLVV